MIIKGTSCYNNAKNGNLVSITGDGGNAWGFFGNSYKKLAPKLYMWEYYSNNPDNLTDEELIQWYIKEYYEVRLKDIDPEMLLQELENKFGNEIILLCHEIPNKELLKKYFCHRRLIADYLEITTGIKISEISINENSEITQEEIYDLKPMIKKLIKNK